VIRCLNGQGTRPRRMFEEHLDDEVQRKISAFCGSEFTINLPVGTGVGPGFGVTELRELPKQAVRVTARRGTTTASRKSRLRTALRVINGIASLRSGGPSRLARVTPETPCGPSAASFASQAVPMKMPSMTMGGKGISRECSAWRFPYAGKSGTPMLKI